MVPFEEYVRVRGDDLLRLAYALSGNARVAQDLVFEVFAKARRGWARIDEGHPETQLRQALVHAYLSIWRRNTPVAPGHPLAALSRMQRSVLVLRHISGLADEDIADHIGRPSATVRALLVSDVDKTALTDFIADAPRGVDVLAGATAKGVRLGRRRIAITGALVAALAAGATIAAVIPPPEPEPDPLPSISPTPDALPPAQLVPATFTMPSFPYEPSYLPPGSDPPSVSKMGRDLFLHYGYFTFTIRRRQPTLAEPIEQVTIAGRQVARHTSVEGDRLFVDLVWLQDAQWLTFRSEGYPLEEAMRIATSLRPGAVPSQPPPFTITLTPPGWTVQSSRVEPEAPVICLTEVKPALEREGFVGLCVSVLEEDEVDPRWPTDPQRATVSGHRAEFADLPGLGSELRVFLGDGRILQVRQSPLTPSSELAPDDVVRFAEGVKVGPRPPRR